MKYLVNYLKGVAIRFSNFGSRASGGTMAIILGIYDDILHAIGSFLKMEEAFYIFICSRIRWTYCSGGV